MRADYANVEMWGKILPRMSEDNALACRCALETGLRVGDVLKIRPRDIKGNTLTFKAEKTGKKGQKTLSNDLAKALRRNAAGGKWCFPSPRTENHRTRQAVWKDVKKAAAEVGIPLQISPHSARKTYAVNTLHEFGIERVQEELQHGSREVTALYAYADVMREGGDRLPPIDGNGDSLINYEYLAGLIADIVVRRLILYFEKCDHNSQNQKGA